MKLDEMVTDKGDPNGRSIFKNGLVWGLGAIVLLAILGAVIWGLDLAGTFGTQKATMQKEAYVQTFNGQNKLGADKDFNQLYNNIVATGSQVTMQQGAIDAFTKANPDYAKNLMLAQQYGQMYSNLTGTKAMLQSEVADYNTKANALQTRNFLPVGYPASINPASPPSSPIK